MEGRPTGYKLLYNGGSGLSGKTDTQRLKTSGEGADELFDYLEGSMIHSIEHAT